MTNEIMAGFGYKMGWLAIRDGVATEVLHALGAQDLEPAGWREGVDQAYRHGDIIVATPPLIGAAGQTWLLVMGRWLDTDTVDVIGLSTLLDREAQFFLTHRVIEGHRWERAISGTLIRSFEYIGDKDALTRWDGKPSPIELAVGLPLTVDMHNPSAFENGVSVNEEDVMRVAGAWSVDPTSLDGQPAPGMLTIARVANGNSAKRSPPRRWRWRRQRSVDLDDAAQS